MTKLKNNANRIIIAVLLCATLIFCTVMLCTNNAANVSADVPEGATESALLVEEEIEDNGNSLWDTQGYEVTREVGTVEIDGVTYDYTTKIRFSVYYNNLSNSSFGFLMADESSIPGLSSFGSGNFEDSTTDASIIDWRSGSSYKRKFRLVFGEDGAKVGKAILTRHVFSDDTTHDASTYLGTVRMLVEVVDTSTSFTFAADAVSAAGGYPHEILIAYATANANDSWNNAEGSRSYVSEFFNHIYINGKSLTEILDDGMKISVNFRRANIELWQCDSANEAVEFKAGDTLVFEKGLRMIEMDLNTNFAYVGQAGYKYVVLERTQEFTFDGTSWSADAYGIVGVNLDQTSSAVDLGDTLQLTATVVAGAKADDSVTFSSSDETVATVDETG